MDCSGGFAMSTGCSFRVTNLLRSTRSPAFPIVILLPHCFGYQCNTSVINRTLLLIWQIWNRYVFVVMKCDLKKRTSSGNAIRRALYYPACIILLSSSSVQKSISKSSPMWPVGCCVEEPVSFCSSVMFIHPLSLILNISSILLPIREVQRTQNDLFMRGQ